MAKMELLLMRLVALPKVCLYVLYLKPWIFIRVCSSNSMLTIFQSHTKPWPCCITVNTLCKSMMYLSLTYTGCYKSLKLWAFWFCNTVSIVICTNWLIFAECWTTLSQASCKLFWPLSLSSSMILFIILILPFSSKNMRV